MKLLLLLSCIIISESKAFGQSDNVYSAFSPTVFEENISLSGYRIVKTVKLDSSNFLLIGEPHAFDPSNEGLRLIHLAKRGNTFQKIFESTPAGESYILKPKFYHLADKVIVVCEMGTEYSWGLKAFLFKESGTRAMGEMDVAANINRQEHPESAIPILQISENEESINFKFVNTTFYGGYKVDDISLILYPGSPNQDLIEVSEIEYRYFLTGSWKVIK